MKDSFKLHPVNSRIEKSFKVNVSVLINLASSLLFHLHKLYLSNSTSKICLLYYFNIYVAK